MNNVTEELELFFLFLVALLLYSYLGYPLLLLILSKIVTKTRKISTEPISPPVSIILSAYNEENVINEAIDNFLKLDYPSDKLELIIVSDGSTDRTNEIVLSRKKDNIRLIIQPERRGKALALNRAVGEAKGEILIFTDADTMFPKEAVKKLIRYFAKREVGLVTGTTRYWTKANNTASTGNAYWRYEGFLKRLESQVGDVVGASGSVYALRKALYRELSPETINDFLHPIEVVLHGYKALFDPEVICYEEATADPGHEFSRQVRMVGQSFLIYRRYIIKLLWQGKFLYAFLLTSHKFLRWLTLPLMGAVLALNLLLWGRGGIYPILGMVQVAFYSVVLLGPVLRRIGLEYRLLTLPFDFCFMNLGGAVGLYHSLLGGVSGVWEKQRM
jgi:cellulose synthase/poly-beta-1,6-N-acetylglucosamine synthase-like glycosyltransferase